MEVIKLNDIVTLYSSKVIYSEQDSNDDVSMAKFVICDFQPNLNNMQINRSTIDNWVSSLQHKPLVGKIIVKDDGLVDFSGHNAKLVIKKDTDGKEYKDIEFDTSAFGSFVEVAIEEVDGIECITATCEIWKRFAAAHNLILKRIREGTLYTSWEIRVKKSHKTLASGQIIKVLDEGSFLGHCLLGASVIPAYGTSRLLEVAEVMEDTEISEALCKDIIELENENKKEDALLGKENGIATAERSNENESMCQQSESNRIENLGIGTSALTDYDLRKKLNAACRAKIDKWCWVSFLFPEEKEVWAEYEGRQSELDYKKFTYSVTNDEVTVSDPVDVKLTVSISEINKKLSEQNEALVKANSAISNLNQEIAELRPYKEKFEQAEQERIQKEVSQKKEKLKSFAISSGLITQEEIETSEDIKKMIDGMDEGGIKSIIAERFVSSLDSAIGGKESSENGIETSEVKPKADLMNISSTGYREFIDAYIGK